MRAMTRKHVQIWQFVGLSVFKPSRLRQKQCLANNLKLATEKFNNNYTCRYVGAANGHKRRGRVAHRSLQKRTLKI